MNTVNYAVDEIITDLGHYNPIELLLRQGRLRYADYESWRNGEIDYIYDAFMGSSKRIFILLNSAQDYVKELGFTAEAYTLTAWQGEKANEPLAFCAADNVIANELLSTQYLRKEDVPQMDLFFDNQGVQLANDLAGLLADRDIKNSEDKLNQLEQVDPNHPLCGQGAELLSAIQKLQLSDIAKDTKQELLYLQRQLAPLAKDVLKGQARDFIAPFWRRLAISIGIDFYDEESRDLNAAYCYAQILLWPDVIKSIEAIPQWQEHAGLFTQLAHAYYLNDQRIESIRVLCEYCWAYPDADIFLPDDSNSIQSWNKFIDLELDEKWGQEYFPVWLLLNEPGLAKNICIVRSDRADVFKMLQQLLQIEQESNEVNADLRLQLQMAHKDIFNYFLNRK
jgi:hypothetical protein